MPAAPAPAAEPFGSGPVVVGPGDDRIHWLGGAMSIFDRGPRSRYALSAAVDELPGGGGPVWHRHTREEETFFVLGGAVDFFTANAPGGVRVTGGGLISLPPGVPHRFRNAREDAASPVLLVTAPGGNMQFFADLSAPLSEPEDPTHPPDPARFADVGARYGITMLGPDGAVGAKVHEEIIALSGGRLPVHVPAGAGEGLSIAGCNVVLKLTGATTAGSCAAAEVTLPPGGSLPTLRHARFGAFVYAFGDGLTLVADDGETPLPAGSAAVVPAGSWYAVRNAGEAAATALLYAAPAGLEHFLRAAGVPSALTARGLPGDAPPPDPARVRAAGAQWGVDVGD